MYLTLKTLISNNLISILCKKLNISIVGNVEADSQVVVGYDQGVRSISRCYPTLMLMFFNIIWSLKSKLAFSEAKPAK